MEMFTVSKKEKKIKKICLQSANLFIGNKLKKLRMLEKFWRPLPRGKALEKRRTRFFWLFGFCLIFCLIFLFFFCKNCKLLVLYPRPLPLVRKRTNILLHSVNSRVIIGNTPCKCTNPMFLQSSFLYAHADGTPR